MNGPEPPAPTGKTSRFPQWTKKNVFWTIIATALVAWGISELFLVSEFDPRIILVFILAFATFTITIRDIMSNRKDKPR